MQRGQNFAFSPPRGSPILFSPWAFASFHFGEKRFRKNMEARRGAQCSKKSLKSAYHISVVVIIVAAAFSFGLLN